MSPLDLIRSRDGSMSQTKLAAACFHFALFVTVCFVTWIKKDFVESMWALYAAAAVGHAAYDKTMATVKDSSDKKLAATQAATEQ